jgi:glycosyltransferase involved in cell wall biosynthesis
MRILFSIHLFPPYHNCGSEYVAHSVIKFLQSRGHEVRVVLHQAKMHDIDVPYTWDGIEVFGPVSVSAPNCLDQYRWANVLCTHLDYTNFTIQMGQMVKRPVVNFIHNDIPYDSINNAFQDNYVVYNSEWVKEKLKYSWPSMVLTPPCDYRTYDVCDNPERNKYITLISLNKNKGGEILYEVARKMPDKQFLGVRGSYDPQIIENLPNVKIVDNTPDILSIYKQTRILLMPSQYESWGRTATEAMCSGIPVICTPTPGLKENCSDAGLYVQARRVPKFDDMGRDLNTTPENYDVTSIVKAIRRLDDKKEYMRFSEKSRARSRELDPLKNLEQLESFLYSTQKLAHA